MPGSLPDRVWDRVPEQSQLFCAFSTGPLLRLGAVMNLSKMEIIYGDMQSMAGKWAGVFMSLEKQRT